MVSKLTLNSKGISEKHSELKQEENNLQETPAKNINTEISKIVSNKIEAMEKFNLKPVTKSGKYELEKDLYDAFSYLASKLNKDIQELASEYMLEAVKKDLKKHNIPVLK